MQTVQRLLLLLMAAVLISALRKGEKAQTKRRAPAAGLIVGLLAGAFGLVVGLFAACAGLVVGGVGATVYGVIMLFSEFGYGLACAGGGICSFALGALAAIGLFKLCKYLLGLRRKSK